MTNSSKQAHTPTAKGLEMLKSLRKAVAQELEKKKRLGQSAVIWQDGQAVIVEADIALAHNNQHSAPNA